MDSLTTEPDIELDEPTSSEQLQSEKSSFDLDMEAVCHK